MLSTHTLKLLLPGLPHSIGGSCTEEIPSREHQRPPLERPLEERAQLSEPKLFPIFDPGPPALLEFAATLTRQMCQDVRSGIEQLVSNRDSNEARLWHMILDLDEQRTGLAFIDTNASLLAALLSCHHSPNPSLCLVHALL